MLEIEAMALDEIIEYENNPKKHPEEQINSIAKSIQEYGARAPILIDDKNVIVAGHGRKLAAQKLNLQSFPVIRVTGLTDEQVKAYRILDNALQESEWDHEFLKIEFKELLSKGKDIELTGFSKIEVDDLFKEDEIPEQNKIIDEDELAKTSHECPKCGGKW